MSKRKPSRSNYPISCNDKIAVLISELEQCREDDRSAITLMFQVIGAGVAAIAIVFTIATSDESGIKMAGWILPVFAIGVLIAVFSYSASLGMKMSLRYHYMRQLEDEIRRISKLDKNYCGWNEIASPIITLNLSHVRSSWTARHFMNVICAFLAVLIVCVVLTVYFFLKLSLAYTVLTLVILLPFFIFFASTVNGASNSAAMYEYAKEAARKRRKDRNHKELSIDSEIAKLVLYLIYPRFKDAMKILFILFGVLIGTTLDSKSFLLSSSWGSVLTAFLVTFFIFDYLGYQARYQWNDIRGYNEDNNNPECDKRGRLPHIVLHEDLAPKISAGVAAYRVLMAFVLCWCNPLNAGFQLAACLLAMFAIAIVYEVARSKARLSATLMLFLVSWGYPLRIIVGIWVACPDLWGLVCTDYNALIFGSIVIGSVFFGMAFVGLTWTLEGCDHYRKKPQVCYHKRHIDSLCTKLSMYFQDPFPLKKSHPVVTVWNIAMLLSLVFMGIPIFVLSSIPSLGVLECALFLSLFISVLIAPDLSKSGIAVCGCAIVILVGVVFTCVYVSVNELDIHNLNLWVLMIMGAIAYLSIYIGFRNSNYETMNDLEPIKRSVMAHLASFIKAVVGTDCAKYFLHKNNESSE